jgi:hypothetical protein
VLIFTRSKDDSFVVGVYGAVAQLGARLNGIQKVAGSIPASSTEEPVSQKHVG